jgi:hypothetical protein
MKENFKEVDYDDVKKALKFMEKHAPFIPPWLQGIGAIIQVIVALIMIRVLSQNSDIIKATNDSLGVQRTALSNAVTQITIEQETRLNPELECGYNWIAEKFMFRNVGDAPTEVCFLRTFVYLVKSNDVYILCPIRHDYNPSYAGPPLDKSLLNPGEIAHASTNFTPNFSWIAESFKKLGDCDVLISIHIEYNRMTTTFRNYSGDFYFTINRSELSFPKDVPQSSFHLMTESEVPYIRNIIEHRNAVPEWKYFFWDVGMSNGVPQIPIFYPGYGSVIMGATNSTWIMGGWAKMH